MKTKSNDQYLTNYEWFIDVLNDESVILCYGSALECLELFTGYLGESEIDVYAKEKGIYENINYRIVYLKIWKSLIELRIGQLNIMMMNRIKG